MYKKARWACCSGTLPQVAADYRINIYFRRPQAVYVNLYVPSTLRWTENGIAHSLTQEGRAPLRRSSDGYGYQFPAHAADTPLPHSGVGGRSVGFCKRQKGSAVPGQFAAIRRQWKTGDRVELELPLGIDRDSARAQVELKGNRELGDVVLYLTAIVG